MAELRIETAEKALELLKDGWPTRAVSLVGSDLRFDLPVFGPHHLVVRFHDVEAADVPGHDVPTKEHVEQVLRHTKNLGAEERLLVHCHAGKSRSPALAIGILVQNGMTPVDALARVKTVRPQLIPNRLITRYLDEVLGLAGSLVAAVEGHYKSLPKDALLPDRGGPNM